MNSRNGKIARLPYDIRVRLNRRLNDAEPGPQILAWLNGIPEVQDIIEEHFDDAPITKQNLSEWRQGGFEEWRLRQDFLNDCQALKHLAEDLDDPDSLDIVADHAATVLAARIGALLTRWDGQIDDKFEARVRAFNTLARSLVQLQRGLRRSQIDSLQAERALHDRDQRDFAAQQEKLIDPFFNHLKIGPIADLFGGGPTGKKIARYITAVQNGNLEAELNPPERVPQPPPQSSPAKSKPVPPPTGLAKAPQARRRKPSAKADAIPPKPAAEPNRTKSDSVKPVGLPADSSVKGSAKTEVPSTRAEALPTPDRTKSGWVKPNQTTFPPPPAPEIAGTFSEKADPKIAL